MTNFYNDNEAIKFQFSHPLMQKIVALKEKNYSEIETFKEAPENFEEAIDNYNDVLEIVGEIAGEVLAPNAEEVDKTGPKIVNNEIVYAPGTQKGYEALKNAELFGMSLPRKYDGLNFPYIPYVMAAEIVSRGDSGFANIWGLQDCAETILEFADDEIKNDFLPRIHKGATCSMDLTEPDAGSDLQSVQLKATFDEQNNCWRLNGVKRFITNGDADIKLVLARSEEGTNDARGLSYFVYDRKYKAVTIRRLENKLGIKASPTAELIFNNAPAKLIGSRRFGLIKYVMSLMNGARLGVAAQAVGIAEAAYRESVNYAIQRKQFGKSILNFPQIYEIIALMRAKIDASRALLYETTRMVDMCKILNYKSQTQQLSIDEKNELKKYQRESDLFTPVLKLFATEFCNQVTYDAIQVFGGSGYMKDYPVERLYRDARITNIYEGTSQLQVVAAIRGVGNDTFINKIKEYQKLPITENLLPLKTRLISLTEQYQKNIQKAIDWGTSSEIYDFHARRLVEIAGYIIMSYILLLDTARSDMFERSTQIFIDYAASEIAKSLSYFDNFTEEKLNYYKN